MYVRKNYLIANVCDFRNLNLSELHNSIGFHQGDKDKFIFKFQSLDNAKEAYEKIWAAMEKGKPAIDITNIL